MRTTSRRQQVKKWLMDLIESNIENPSENGYENTIRDLRASSCSWKSSIDNAQHYLQGLGLAGFPFYDDDIANTLVTFGYRPTAYQINYFWRRCAELLCEILAEHKNNNLN